MQDGSINLLDIVILVVCCYNAYSGFKKGFLKMAFDLAALIVGVFVALKYYTMGAAFLQKTIQLQNPYAIYLSFLMIWGLVFSAFFGIQLLCQSILRKTLVGSPINSLLGSAFGALRGLCYVMPFLIPLSHTNLALYHSSRIAIPLKEMTANNILNTKPAQTLVSGLGLQKQKEVSLEKDPNLLRMRRALESGNSAKIQDLLHQLDKK
ncbi:hypothetical protein DID77_00610 [Candidatus Marinamargulisbacteria bacterium SCGC AG-439-L15]|nr:hypothetical protein DID77_00610 [Candidatus Marinamargulisbacteria bacterium SCGC AG-439-L15]